ncbi:MAG: DUF481 domain-containing protein, partial [Acidobacteria bacterium]|nr:DUF481 domain-containing protein [Acidobacteriota bacterium]
MRLAGLRAVPLWLLPLLLNADQVTLTNGDRITGDILNTDDKTLTLKTAAMGEVKIDRAAIASLASAEPLTVTLTKGEKLVGTIEAGDRNARVTTAPGNVVTVPRAEVAAIRGAAAQAAWDREQVRLAHPPLNDFWSGTIGINLASATGNAKTTTFGTGASAQRATGVDRLVLTYSQIYSNQSTVAPFGATANRISGGLRYDRTLTGRLFAFGFNSYDYDEFLDLDLRSVLGGGLGFHAYKSGKNYWDLSAGGDWNREAFGTGLVRNSGELVISEESGHQVTTIVQ